MGMGGGRGFHRMNFDEPVGAVAWHLLPRVLSYYRPYIWQILLVLLAILLQAGLNLIPPLLRKTLVDNVLPSYDFTLLVWVSFGWIATAVTGGLVSVGEAYLNNWIGLRIIRDIRNRMFAHLQQLPLSFFNMARTGEVISRLNNDVNGIQGVVSGTVTSAVSNVANLVFVLATIFTLNWKLALVGCAVVPLFVIPTRLVGKTRWRMAKATQEKFSVINAFINERLGVSGIILGKIFDRRKHESATFNQLSEELAKYQLKDTQAGRWFFMAIRTFESIGPAMIFWYGGVLFIRGEITIGTILAFAEYLSRLYRPVTQLSNLHVDIARSMALFERIFEYLDMEVECPGNENLPSMPPIQGRIVFDRVSFRYGPGPEVLTDVSFSVEPGQLVALVGPSGAGKTTITNLVPRLYEISSGAILIDDIDVRTVSLSSLRQQIGMVTQDTFLFNTTIRDNLLYARPTATEEEMIAAARAANIHDFISGLPEGYDTVVGERGVKLSGGEKQRISIARVILKDPRIFILDEATSSLDSRVEHLVQQALAPLIAERTSLVIAHRLSTILAADLILVVDKGRIVESGTHSELLALNGLYAELYEQQFSAQAEGVLPGEEVTPEPKSKRRERSRAGH
ncbi:MAG: ABC transporter ATP-binding protein [Limnochordia bacterium]